MFNIIMEVSNILKFELVLRKVRLKCNETQSVGPKDRYFNPRKLKNKSIVLPFLPNILSC